MGPPRLGGGGDEAPGERQEDQGQRSRQAPVPAHPPAHPPAQPGEPAFRLGLRGTGPRPYTNREIAAALGTAEGTVKIHVSNILSKLGARDRTQAVLSALELGLL